MVRSIAVVILLVLCLFPARPFSAENNERPDLWEDRFFTVILNDEDKLAYEAVAEDEKLDWRRRFWGRLDPTPTTPENRNEGEHQQRVLFAIGEFRDADGMFVWDDRARATIRFGSPEKIENIGDKPEETEFGAPVLLWKYPEMILRFEETDRPGHYHFSGSPDRSVAPELRGLCAVGAERWREKSDVYEDGAVDGGELEILFELAPYAGKDGATDILIGYSVPDEQLAFRKEGKWMVARMRCSVASRAADSRMDARIETELEHAIRPEAGRSGRVTGAETITVPPGPHRIAIRVEDLEGGEKAVRAVDIDVPDFSGDVVQVSRPIRARAVYKFHTDEPVFDRMGYLIAPRPKDVYVRGEEIHFYYEVYNLRADRDGRFYYELNYRLSGSAPVSFTCPIDSSNGGVLTADEEHGFDLISKGSAAGKHLYLDSASLPAGEYTLSILVSDDSGGRAATETRFVVVDP